MVDKPVTPAPHSTLPPLGRGWGRGLPDERLGVADEIEGSCGHHYGRSKRNW